MFTVDIYLQGAVRLSLSRRSIIQSLFCHINFTVTVVEPKSFGVRYSDIQEPYPETFQWQKKKLRIGTTSRNG